MSSAHPGRAGIVEASLSGLLILAGVRPGYAVLATLAYRIASYWLLLLAGLPAYLFFRHRYGRAGPPARHDGHPRPTVTASAACSSAGKRRPDRAVGLRTRGQALLRELRGRSPAAMNAFFRSLRCSRHPGCFSWPGQRLTLVPS